MTCLFGLASCSRATVPLPAASPAAAGGTIAPQAARYRQLYLFHGAPAGSGPTGILYLNGLLYGTTTGGGSKTLGTVFVRGLSGKVRTIHSFQGVKDGAQPDGALLELNGTFYGTTEYGGARGAGTVFAVTPNGKARVVYSFKGGSDGANPILAGLVALGGKLYGTTNAGGDTTCSYQYIVGCGIVFDLTTSGKERVLYRFDGKPDGACPSGSLIESGGVIYGTTNFGGAYNNGSVFRITTAGTKTTIYSFKGYPDGVTPFGGLTVLNGTFYGTTTLGGAFQGAGTVFALSPSGSERVLHSFRGSPDGALPYGGLTAVGNTLYGTTELGGSSGPACVGRGIIGCGTVFSVSTSGSLSVLYRLRGHQDGMGPLAGLVASQKGVLYGTTFAGGLKNNGTIFEVTP